MADATTIANLASALTGSETRITSLDDERHMARTIKAVWAIERRATLRDGLWNFAVKRFELAAQVLAGGVPFPWQSSFPMPAESLRLIEVLNSECRDAYQLEGGAILTDSAGPLYVRCICDIEEPALWDDAFAEAFACRIAVKIGPRIAGSAYNEQAGWGQYQRAIASAKGVDAMENPPLEQEDSSWISARWGYSGGFAG